MNPTLTLRARLYGGLFSLFLLPSVAVTVALSATRAIERELAHVEGLAEESRRLVRVGALFREYYMHQAHLALGMHEAEHLALTREAHEALAESIESLAGLPDPAVAGDALPEARRHLADLDRLFEGEFLPSLRAGHREHAAHTHHRAADSVQKVTQRLTADETRLGGLITAARERALAASRQAALISALALGGALLLCLGVAAWMVRGVSGPVARLRSAAQGLPAAPPGTRVPEDGPAELAELGRTLNVVLTELEAQRRARGEAETMATLGRVAAGVAHEINNPLGVILGHARLVERAGTDSAATESARAIADEARHCQHIVQDLLDYARPGLGSPRRLDLAELARAAAERAPPPEGELSVEAPASPIWIDADERRVEGVLRNLLANAAAFGRDVRLQVHRDNAQAVAVVADDGPGVPPEALDRIFEPFFTTRPEGTGLGLAIARAVAHAHRGTLVAYPGPGGRFELRLPLAQD